MYALLSRKKDNCYEIKILRSGQVPASTFFCLDETQNRIVGAINIRHELNDSLLLNGRHIGDGIRPSERNKGFATKMIPLALEEYRRNFFIPSNVIYLQVKIQRKTSFCYTLNHLTIYLEGSTIEIVESITTLFTVQNLGGTS